MTLIKFGTDGWRGVIADDFTVANVRKVACAIARYVVRAEKPSAGVLVGYDTRFASERFARGRRNRLHDRHARVAGRAGVPYAGGFPAGASTRRGGGHHDHSEPQSLP